MRSITLPAAVFILLASGIVGARASADHTVRHPAPVNLASLAASQLHAAASLRLAETTRSLSPLQTGTTATPSTATPSATTTPTVTITSTPVGTSTVTPRYPDPVTLVQNAITVLDQIHNVRFGLVTAGEQKGIDKLHIAATGKATCKGPAMQAHVKATNTLEATNRTAKQNFSFIQVKKNVWLKSKATHNRWAKSKASKTKAFGFTTDNPLNCPNAPQSGGGSGSGPTLKKLVNLGPDKFRGVAVWHVRATGILQQGNGQSANETLDLWISQDHYLLYKSTVAIDDPHNAVTLSQTQTLTQFGKKVVIKAPKVGSRKP